MSSIPQDYVRRVYAGWLGKLIGIRMGADIEGWTHERIRQVYGVLDGYPVDYQKKYFAADDDSNGPFFFLRALRDYTPTRTLTAEQIGLTWLNYAPFEHGFFWWGGYGKSTEHTAYLNLRNGIAAPRSGSGQQNGAAVAEQIGGQIFIDTWGLVCPGNPQLAAEYADKAASVSHDGNGVYGGRFIAACVAAAFTQTDPRDIIQSGLAQIPADCAYARMARDVIAAYEQNPSDWEKTFAFVRAHYGYDRYPGACHILPNAAVVILSLLHGGGDFSRSVNLCAMCGWDTDCNAANVGAILGVLRGLDGIDFDKWRKPINDFIVYSSVIGSLNLSDIPSDACEIAELGYRVMGEAPPAAWADVLGGSSARYPFRLPGSTHGFLCDQADAAVYHAMVNGQPCLQISGIQASSVSVYHPAYLHSDAFRDSRYDPSFSPLLYPGYRISCRAALPAGTRLRPLARVYAYDEISGREYQGDAKPLSAGEWTDLSFVIPPLRNARLSRTGLRIESDPASPALPGTVYMTDFDFRGLPDYTLDFACESMEDWGGLHREVGQFSYLKGIWTLEQGELSGSCADYGEAYTGDYGWRNLRMSVDVIPQIGVCHRVLFRVQGAIRCYAAALTANGLELQINRNGYTTLAAVALSWKHGQPCRLEITAAGDVLIVSCGGETVSALDNTYAFGMVGLGVGQGSHAHFNHLRITGVRQPVPIITGMGYAVTHCAGGHYEFPKGFQIRRCNGGSAG